jgi:hypothetical protein
MILEEKTLFLPKVHGNKDLLLYFNREVSEYCRTINSIPVRFVVSETTEKGYHCELGVLSEDITINNDIAGIFDFRKRKIENQNKFNAVVLVPTGIGAKLGGHSGDSGAMVRLLASVCDVLVTHPNVVNAADINEIPDNTLYVEGSVISRLLMGTVGLQKVRANRVLVIIDEHQDKMFHELAINSVSAARVSLGMNCAGIVKMKHRTIMRAFFAKSGRAVGRIEYFERLTKVLDTYKDEFDAVALTSLIEVPIHFHKDYFTEEMEVNPWGGVEAMLTHAVSSIYNIPSAHSPMMTSNEVLNLDVGIVDPRKSAEAVSTTYLHCILKGLHRSPKIVDLNEDTINREALCVEDISCLVIPEKCLGLPTLAALEQGIHVIVVTENTNYMKNNLVDLPFRQGRFHVVNNYLEAVGVMVSIKAGISLETVKRPIELSKVDEIVYNTIMQDMSERK